MKNKYTVDYFIKKFEAIPRNQWTTGELVNEKNQKCALGHCGGNTRGFFVDQPAEFHALHDLFTSNSLDTATVNDGRDFHYKQKTPKSRILAALRDFKND